MEKSLKITIIISSVILAIFILIFAALFLLTHQSTSTQSIPSPSPTYVPNCVNVKYRESGCVDIANSRFEYLDTSKSSWIEGAWYDTSNQYMVINLKGTYYHYCSVPKDEWESFKLADSFGTYYNSYIKGSYDCRANFVPQYNDNG